jgi:heavy metal translocating P-type ATPase
MLLPFGAAAFLLAGVVCWLAGTVAPVTADRVWVVGLLVTGPVVVWRTLVRVAHGQFASDLVALLSIIGAAALHEPLAGLVIVLMQTGGEWLELIAQGRASAAVRELEAASPRQAHRMRDGIITDLPADQVQVGDVLFVRPGELVPCDAVVIEGHSAVDVSRLTGEPIPLDATEGTVVASGSANGNAPLTLRATAVARDSQYARIVELVRSAQASKAPLQRLADKYAVWFTPATLIVCALAWYWSGDARRALAVLVVATPCPLILAAPIAFIGGINRAARRQIVIRSGGALEGLSAITAAMFDKTGTLTLGHPELARVRPLGAWTDCQILRLAGSVEMGAGHLLARTLVSAAEQKLAAASQTLPVATLVQETAGRGVVGVVDGRQVAVGAWRFIRDRYPATSDALDALDREHASTPGLRAYVAIDGEVAAVIEYADRLREDAGAVVSEFRALGVHRIMLLSGDHAPTVAAIAAEVGIADWHYDMQPADKAALITSLVKSGERVLMIGDGTNDAPALSSASVGVALAAHGGGISAEAADVVVLADHLARVPEAMRISRRTMRIARQSIGVGLGLSMVAMIAASVGLLRPTTGALLQEGIDVAVILNALRASR